MANPQIRQVTEPPHVTDQRHAAALSEIQRMREDYSNMQRTLAEAESENSSLRHRVDILAEDKERYRSMAELFQRKLVRLATAMSGIGALTAEAEKIIKDVSDAEAVRKKDEPAAARDETLQREVVSLLKGTGVLPS